MKTNSCLRKNSIFFVTLAKKMLIYKNKLRFFFSSQASKLNFLHQTWSFRSIMPSLLTIFFLLFTTLLFAQAGYKTMTDITAFKNNVTKSSKETNTIESNFVQEKNLNVLSEKVISKGKFYFKKTNLLRWEYLEPYKYIVIMNNNKININDENKSNTFDAKSNKTFKEINNIMLGTVQGNLFSDETRFKSTFFEGNDYYLVKMEPLKKELKELFKKINIYFNKKDFSVSKLEMTEVSDDFTSIIFSNKKLNQSIGNEKFTIK